MESKTIVAFIIIIGVVLSLITVSLMRDYPETSECCKDIRDAESTICYHCADYNTLERMIYVWRFRDTTNEHINPRG